MQKQLLEKEIRLLEEAAQKAKEPHFEQIIRTIADKEVKLEQVIIR